MRDEVTLTELTVTGEIPEHLDGRYVRIGPNPVGQPDPATHHWFVGDGMVHGVRLRDGRAEWYRNRWVRSTDVAEALGEPCRPGRAARSSPTSRRTPTSSPTPDGRWRSPSRASAPTSSPTSSRRSARRDFDGTLPVGWTAHPHADPATGEFHAVSYWFGWGNIVHYTVLDADGRIRRQVPIEVHGAPMIHDFSLTANHVVIYDLPVRFDLDMVMEGAGLPYRWDADYPARVGVMHRESDGSDVRWFDVEPCYVYHPMNAYEDGGQIVLDVARHPKSFDTVRNGPNEGPPTLDRWTIDLAGGKVIETRLDDRGQEFPRFDERLTGHRHRYGYTVGGDPGEGPVGLAVNTVFRHEVGAGRTTHRSFGPGAAVSEFVFVPSAPDSAEDDGVLMGYTHDLTNDQSTLTLLDSQTLETVASVAIPARIPYGFHGNWLP